MENVGIVRGSILNLVPPCTYYRHMDYIDAYRGIFRYLGNKLIGSSPKGTRVFPLILAMTSI